MACTISITISLAVLQLNLGVTLTGKEGTEQVEKINTVIEKAEKNIEAEPDDPQPVAEEQDQDTNDTSLMKRLILNGIDKLIAGLKSTSAKMAALGIVGTVGLTGIIQAYNVGIQIGVSMTLGNT